MANFNIQCPYCFETFSHTAVHFRAETCFSEDQLNDSGYTETDIQRMNDREEQRRLMAQMRARRPFLRKDDEKYERFWKDYGQTTERTTGVDRTLTSKVEQLPILDPSTEESQEVLKPQRGSSNGERSAEDFFIYDGDGMVTAVEDIYNHETHRRVCPYCHNPLPLGFGKYPLKFISVIGVTGAGKTVYISQLLKNMNSYASYVSMATYYTSDHETNFIEDNPVEADKPLPRPTMDGQLSQPMFYDLVQALPSGKTRTDTIVIYDIAGENCKTAQAMVKFGKFVTKSDGIILLVDPTQLDLVMDGGMNRKIASAEPNLVLNTIHNAFVDKTGKDKQDIPIAVCISKSDSFEEHLPDVARTDIRPVTDRSDNYLPLFNATEYNQLEPRILDLLRHNPMVTNLKTGYKNFNFFIFSATGCGVEDREDKRSYPVAPPVPKRIAEPLLWLFHKFGYIRSDTPILLPFPRPMPEFVNIPPTGLRKIFHMKPKTRPLTEEEKDRYRYEEN